MDLKTKEKQTMIHYPNKYDLETKFWNKNYRISITAQGIDFIVNADSESDAIDFIIDYCQENELSGLVSTYEELKADDCSDTEINDYVYGGNEGLYLTTNNIQIIDITFDKNLQFNKENTK